jgi:sarcosine oxidase
VAPTRGPERFALGRHPVWIWETPDGMQPYGFPAHEPGRGVKLSLFRAGEPTTPDTIDRQVHDRDVAVLRRYLAGRLPDLADGELLDAVTCMYTNTPDEHFVIAVHPRHPQVAVAAGFSGHGFKFVPVVGEVLADLVIDGATTRPIGLFDPARLLSDPRPGTPAAPR